MSYHHILGFDRVVLDFACTVGGAWETAMSRLLSGWGGTVSGGFRGSAGAAFVCAAAAASAGVCPGDADIAAVGTAAAVAPSCIPAASMTPCVLSVGIVVFLITFSPSGVPAKPC